MTPLEAIGYAFAAVIVSPVVLGLLIALLVLGVFLWESRKAQVALVVAGLIYGGTRLVIWGASRPPAPPTSCQSRCEDYWESDRLKCLQLCYESEKLIKENEGVKP
jgi:hypothetical protein